MISQAQSFRGPGNLAPCRPGERFAEISSHRSLRVTPAMEANLTDHVWKIAELLSQSICYWLGAAWLSTVS